MALLQLRAARRPPRIVRRQYVEEALQYGLRLSDQRDRGLGETRWLFRIGVDAYYREIVVDPAMLKRRMQLRADGEYDVGLGPEFAAERQVHGQRIAIADDAAAAPVGDDRRL